MLLWRACPALHCAARHVTLPGGMMDAFAWIEQTALSRLVREDIWAYFVLLILHAWGMAFLVGGGMAVSLRVLGVASGARLERFAGFFPFMRAGAMLAVLSGLGLLAGYPAKALTNGVFGLKLGCFLAAGLIVWWLARRIFPIAARGEALPVRAKGLAALALLLWFAGVACGKLLLYTNTMLLVS
jgi:hypothetical protein